MQKLEEFAKHISVGVRAAGEIYSPHPRMYYWRCWLGDEFCSVSLSEDIRHPPVRGLGMDLLSSMQDLVRCIRGQTIFVRRGMQKPDRFQVDADLIV